MAHVSMAAASDAPNHPKAISQAAIAFLSFNIGVGSVMGTPGVLLPHMQEHLGVSAEAASAGLLLVMVASAVFAPQIGGLAIRRSLRGLMVSAAIMMTVAWLLLAFTRSYPIFLAVNALLFGPCMAITGSVLSPTLITRWFNRHRGLAIGLCHIPIMVAIMPIAAEWVIQQIGMQRAFLVLAALPIVTMIPASFFLIDWPPSAAGATAQVSPAAASAEHGPVFSMGQILKNPKFWALSLAVGMPNTSSILLGLHLVSMAKSWGISALAGAGLASIMSGVGMIGIVCIGYLTDRLGGARALAVIATGDIVLWLLMLTQPNYTELAAIIGMIGFFGAGAVPSISKAYGDLFGQASFSRAIGLMVPVTLPLLAIGLIAPGAVVRITGSYTAVILAMAGAFVLALLLALYAAGSKPADDRAVSPA